MELVKKPKRDKTSNIATKWSAIYLRFTLSVMYANLHNTASYIYVHTARSSYV